MKRINSRRLIAAGAAGLMVLAGTNTAFAASTDPSDEVIPYIVGGTDATHPWPAMASLQIDHKGNPNWHTCGASLVNARYVVTNAHCVTLDDGTAADPARFHLRIGSTDRTTGGVTVTVDKVLPHAAWDWGTGDDPIADIALLRLSRPVGLRPFPIAPHLARPSTVTRLLGWGLTEPDAQDVPIMLQQLDTRLVPTARCAAAGITAGEICVDNTAGTGACYGDSGGPALQKVTTNRWQLVGGASRETTAACGDGPTVYTDSTYYKDWVRQVVRTGEVPVPTGTLRSTSTAQPVARDLTWIGGTARQ